MSEMAPNINPIKSWNSKTRNGAQCRANTNTRIKMCGNLKIWKFLFKIIIITWFMNIRNIMRIRCWTFCTVFKLFSNHLISINSSLSLNTRRKNWSSCVNFRKQIYNFAIGWKGFNRQQNSWRGTGFSFKKVKFITKQKWRSTWY